MCVFWKKDREGLGETSVNLMCFPPHFINFTATTMLLKYVSSCKVVVILIFFVLFFVKVYSFTFQLLGLTGLWSRVLTKHNVLKDCSGESHRTSCKRENR